MKSTNQGSLMRTLTPALGLLFMLTAVTISQGSIRRHSSTTATPRQESSMRGTYRATAQRIGRSDGLKAGRRDRKRGQPSNFRDETKYQNGANGYKPKMGNKEIYKQVYQSAFENGYDAGYNGY